MIITRQKPIEQIMGFIESYKKVLVVGCDGCFQPPRSEKEANILGLLLRLKNQIKRAGREPLQTVAMTVLRQCDDRIVATALKPVVRDHDPGAIISMACGIGVQIMARVLDHVPVFPGQDTLFYGAEMHEKNAYEEYCRACGDCMLGETAAICPVAGCAKSLDNGPCGGTVDGKCEVGNYTKPCAWVEIWERMRHLGRLDAFRTFRPPRDHRPATTPGAIKVKDTFPDDGNVLQGQER